MAGDPRDMDPDERLALAKYEAQRGELQRALAMLKPLIAAERPPADSLAVLARLYARIGLMERAQAAFRRYLEYHPGAVHETFELGATYFDEGDDGKALEYWDRALALQPTHPPALFYSAAALSRTGKPADARRQLDVLLKSAPADNVYVERARDLLKTLEAAPTAAEAAAPANPYGGH